jgi:hypothetical protein
VWKPINSFTILKEICVGNVIANNPYSPAYKIKNIRQNGYLTAVREKDSAEIKMFLTAHLIDGNWWLKTEQ